MRAAHGELSPDESTADAISPELAVSDAAGLADADLDNLDLEVRVEVCIREVVQRPL